MKKLDLIIEELMNKATQKNIALECIKMEQEEDIKNVSFYVNGNKITLDKLSKLLEIKTKI